MKAVPMTPEDQKILFRNAARLGGQSEASYIVLVSEANDADASEMLAAETVSQEAKRG